MVKLSNLQPLSFMCSLEFGNYMSMAGMGSGELVLEDWELYGGDLELVWHCFRWLIKQSVSKRHHHRDIHSLIFKKKNRYALFQIIFLLQSIIHVEQCYNSFNRSLEKI